MVLDAASDAIFSYEIEHRSISIICKGGPGIFIEFLSLVIINNISFSFHIYYSLQMKIQE